MQNQAKFEVPQDLRETIFATGRDQVVQYPTRRRRITHIWSSDRQAYLRINEDGDLEARASEGSVIIVSFIPTL